ncbi:PIG-L family deacetylase [Pengzhenrongella frigida]|uniref:GlcNAc-PI de-N-acetylase n=1 Tax=Pengzhenrongella frigida TaxID=1259133 RepID=A0A4V1ZHG7_9MICO|nr:PIG-L family deacetylase [Cellulomonas sp. HLT2-17]RYV51984.1 GlcNAc-PI de-N-acetylase [Cellulomonas sp. HLT2-17]
MTGPTGGLLVVHAHPDDETLATGGLIAVWAGSGRPVTVVTCTRGELGEVIGDDPGHLEGDGPALAAHREGELAAALAALGVVDQVFLDSVADGDVPDGDPVALRFSDSGMAWAGVGRAGRVSDLPDGAFVAVPLDAAARRLAAVIRSRRPEVVATYEPGGGYGHPDHVRTHDVTMRALELAGDPHLVLDDPPHIPGAVLAAVVPADTLRAAYRALTDLPAVTAQRVADPHLALPDPGGPLPSVAVAGDLVDLVVDVTGVLDRVAAALSAHRTQVRSIALDADRLAQAATGPRDRPAVVVGCYALSNDVLAPLLSQEFYRSVPVGVDLEDAWRAAGISWPAAVRPVA